VLLHEEALGVLSLLVYTGVVLVESCGTEMGVIIVGVVLLDDGGVDDGDSICCTRTTSTSLYLLRIAEQNFSTSSGGPHLLECGIL